MIIAKDVSDCIGNQIFNKHNKGWLIFIDPCTIANWSHPCTYLFLFDDYKVLTSHEGWPPSDNINLEMIDI